MFKKEKEKENISKKAKKNSFISHHALHATTNEINVLKNKMNCLSSTLSSCAFKHSRFESLFSKKQTPHIHTHHSHAYAHIAAMIIHIHICILRCTNVHIVVAKAI